MPVSSPSPPWPGWRHGGGRWRCPANCAPATHRVRENAARGSTWTSSTPNTPDPEHVLHAGRRHLVHGRSLGVNPLDVAVDPLDLDRSKDTDRRRNEIEGQDMLGFRVPARRPVHPGRLLDRRASAPCWRARSPCRSGAPDLTVLAFDDERPGAGLSFSRTLGEAVLLYGDAVVRRGRDRPAIRADRRPGATRALSSPRRVSVAGSSRGPASGPAIRWSPGPASTSNTISTPTATPPASGTRSPGLIAENDANRRAGRFGGLPRRKPSAA